MIVMAPYQAFILMMNIDMAASNIDGSTQRWWQHPTLRAASDIFDKINHDKSDIDIIQTQKFCKSLQE